jgi:hypothetical protein
MLGIILMLIFGLIISGYGIYTIGKHLKEEQHLDY